ncbi:MAG: hypothetical protein AB1634_08910 [Thermodesulfobacteriota bacterium]
MTGWPRRALAWAQRIFTPLALVFIAVTVWRSRASLEELAAGARIGRLALAVAIWSCLQFLAPLFSRTVLAAADVPVSFRRAWTIHVRRLPARYLPGGIWHTVGRAADYHQFGVQPRRLALFFFLETGLAPALALLLGGFCLFVQLGSSRWGLAGALGMAAGGLGLGLIPVLAHRFMPETGGLTLARYLKATGIMGLFWLGAGATFVTYLSAFGEGLLGDGPLAVAGTYLFAWAVGNLTIFAPQGLGVFEMVAGGILHGALPLGSTAALMAGFRLVVLASDLIAWALGEAGQLLLPLEVEAP